MPMQVTHPRALDDDAGPPPSAVDVRGRTVPLDEEDSFETGDEAWVRQFADAHDVDVETIVDGRDGAGDVDLDDVDADVGETGKLPLNPAEYTIGELTGEIEGIDDETALVAIRNLEEEQKDRTGATDAIADRLEEIREE